MRMKNLHILDLVFFYPFFIMFAMAILSISVLLFSGCGKKGDPLPPLANMPEPPVGLTYSLDRDNATITIRWNNLIKHDGVNQASDIAGNHKPDINGIEVFRASVNLSKDACKGCPLEFKRMTSLPFPVSEYRQPIEKGFLYFYKIKSYTDNNISSQFSETIEFEFQ